MDAAAVRAARSGCPAKCRGVSARRIGGRYAPAAARAPLRTKSAVKKARQRRFAAGFQVSRSIRVYGLDPARSGRSLAERRGDRGADRGHPAGRLARVWGLPLPQLASWDTPAAPKSLGKTVASAVFQGGDLLAAGQPPA